jgi:hypothetical protein
MQMSRQHGSRQHILPGSDLMQVCYLIMSIYLAYPLSFCRSALSVDLGSDSYAAMVKNTLSVDREVQCISASLNKFAAAFCNLFLPQWAAGWFTDGQHRTLLMMATACLQLRPNDVHKTFKISDSTLTMCASSTKLLSQTFCPSLPHLCLRPPGTDRKHMYL